VAVVSSIPNLAALALFFSSTSALFPLASLLSLPFDSSVNPNRAARWSFLTLTTSGAISTPNLSALNQFIKKKYKKTERFLDMKYLKKKGESV
jgi:hypothetical protein